MDSLSGGARRPGIFYEIQLDNIQRSGKNGVCQKLACLGCFRFGEKPAPLIVRGKYQ